MENAFSYMHNMRRGKTFHTQVEHYRKYNKFTDYKYTDLKFFDLEDFVYL